MGYAVQILEISGKQDKIQGDFYIAHFILLFSFQTLGKESEVTKLTQA